MPIPADKNWMHTPIMVQVTYYPVYRDGHLGHKQTASLPWEGDVVDEKTLLELTRKHFIAKWGPGQDKVTNARLWDKKERRYLDFVSEPT